MTRPLISQVGNRRAYVLGDSVALKKLTGHVRVTETGCFPYVSLGDVRAAKRAAKLWVERGKVSRRIMEAVSSGS